MNINDFQNISVSRSLSEEAKVKWGDVSNRNLKDWAICIGGEVGEFLNAVKKYQMYEHDINQLPGLRQACVDELSDVMTYAVLCYYALGVFDVESELIKKFNEVSKRIGWEASQ